ncbi:cationic amino acid transporter 6, chloroplastic-like [Phalaenopsis equestris]|uniref:cationic amino acid transporter 6, chloroplastic-like n=1 Tax=Phalaenopsis equestris TaxID=78828 RepID=UPI0009E1E00A|nr:cationic amino acid transporter 6, chloroplastic-like [Phalaenopsis equestris]
MDRRQSSASPAAKRKSPTPSFASLRAYGRAITETHRRFSRRAGSVTTTSEEMSRVRARSGPDMARTLRWTDLVGLGIGGMVGAGVFVTTGRAARDLSGPAIIVSFAIAGLCALLSAFCYTEFAVELPVAGGAFSYLRVTFGEFAAFLTGANLVMEYVFSNAAVARSFTAYLGTAIGVETEEKWRITIAGLPNGFNNLDPLAVGLILILTLCICYSTKDSSKLNLVLTATHLFFILFIIVIGFWRGEWKNLTLPASPENHAGGFMPYGVGGVFNGAAAVYMSYIGYDAVSTMAEEVKSPARDIPMGVSGSVVIVTLLYCLMAASMTLLVPYDAIDGESPFSSAFKGSDGWGWVSNVIGVGASFGILTSILVSMLGQARYLCVIARAHIIPARLAKVHAATSTPVNASLFLGGLTATIALFTDLNVLLNLVTIGTLFVFYMVANAVIHRRYVSVGSTNPWPTVVFLLFFSLSAVGFTVAWRFLSAGGGDFRTAVLCGGAASAAAALCAFSWWVPQVRKPELWGLPLMPVVPAISIFLNVFLLGLLDWQSYVRFAVFTGFAVVFYLLYGVHASFDAEESGELLPELQNCISMDDGRRQWEG